MSMDPRRRVVMSRLYCDECGTKVDIPRRKGRRKRDGHTKHMWCHACKKVTAHTEANNLISCAVGSDVYDHSN